VDNLACVALIGSGASEPRMQVSVSARAYSIACVLQLRIASDSVACGSRNPIEWHCAVFARRSDQLSSGAGIAEVWCKAQPERSSQNKCDMLQVLQVDMYNIYELR
jgi:hypothetical protein